MLQQTRVEAVIPYYDRWMIRFPTVLDLALAREEELLSYWQGLGYYRRCCSLWRGAKHVVSNGWPKTASEWRDVPGVGAYTAAAIASICLNEPIAVVDGNVERVFARQTCSENRGSKLKAAASQWAQSNLEERDPGTYNQALMELGATTCTPKKPQCDRCPISGDCQARARGEQAEFPKHVPKPDTIELHWRIVIPECDGRLGLFQLKDSRWWKGMWSFPTFELGDPPPAWQGGNVIELGRIKHAVTRHRLMCSVAYITLDYRPGELAWLTREEICERPLPSLQTKALRLTQGLY